jgi:hypothetical protein
MCGFELEEGGVKRKGDLQKSICVNVEECKRNLVLYQLIIEPSFVFTNESSIFTSSSVHL